MQLNYYHKALILVAVGIFYTNVPAYVFSLHATPFEAKHWVMAFCLLALPLLIRYRAVWNALTSPIIAWCLLYACLTLVWFALSSQADAPWQEVRNRFLAMIQILAFLMIFWEPAAASLAKKMLVPAVLMGVGFNIYELFAPMSFSPIPGRSAGLYENSTLAGEALVLGMILSVTALPLRYRGLFMLLTGIGILTTFSRGGMLGWTIAVAGFIFLRRISLKDFLPSLFIGLAIGMAVLLPQWDRLLTTWERTGVLNANVQERLAWFTDPSGTSDYSSWERKYLAQRTWAQIAERPILGKGTGSYREGYMPPHNQYLSFMLDHGLIGAIVIPLLIFATMWGARGEPRSVGIVFGYTFMILCLFTHTILNTAYSLMLLSLMAAMSARSYDPKTQRSDVIEKSEDEPAEAWASA